MAEQQQRDAEEITGGNTNNSRLSQRINQLNRHTYRIRRTRIASNIRSGIVRNDKGTYWFIKDIIPDVTFEEGFRIIETYDNYNESQKNHCFILGWHPEKENKGHFHFYHSCAYNQSHCRCGFLGGIRFKRRQPGHSIEVNSVSQEHIENIIKYLLEKPRELVHIQIGGKSYGEEIHRLKNLRSSFDIDGDSSERSVEMCELSLQDGGRSSRLSSISNDPSEDKGVKRFISEGLSNIPWVGPTFGSAQRKLRLNQYLIKHLIKYLVIPIESTCQTHLWLDNPNLCIYEASNPDYKLAVSTLQRLTTNLTFEELYSLHTTPGNSPIYSERNGNHYYSLEESTQHCENLLLHQYGNRDGVKDFIQRLYSICEKIIPKKNSMFIQGRRN